jgi:large subunit ribosomal protein L23
MPLFGFRTDKKHQQSHIQAEAGLAKSSSVAGKKGGAMQKGARRSSSAKPEKIAQAVMTKDAGAAKSATVQSPALPSGAFSIAAGAIIRPRVTEKSGILSQSGMYTFEVMRDANKHSIAKAVKALYKVTPVKVAVLNSPAKKVFLRGKSGHVPGFRKAVVTLKAGDKIDFV